MRETAIETANRLIEEGYDEREAVEEASRMAQQERAERHADDVDMTQQDSPR